MISFRRFTVLLVAIAVMAGLHGCASMKMDPVPNHERLALSAEDVVTILSAIGFRDEEIVKRGRNFRNQLAQHGAVTLRRGGTTVAMVAIRGSMVHVSSMTVGSFVYDPMTGTLR